MLALGVGSLLVALNRGPALGLVQSVSCWSRSRCFPRSWSRSCSSNGVPAIRSYRFGTSADRTSRSRSPISSSRTSRTWAASSSRPLLLQEQLGYGEAKTGFLSIARPLTFAITGPIAGYVTTRIGERKNAVIGSLFIVIVHDRRSPRSASGPPICSSSVRWRSRAWAWAPRHPRWRRPWPTRSTNTTWAWWRRRSR